MKFLGALVGLILSLCAVLSLLQPLTRLDWMAHVDMGGQFVREIHVSEYGRHEWGIRGIEAAVLLLGVWLLYDGIRRCIWPDFDTNEEKKKK